MAMAASEESLLQEALALSLTLSSSSPPLSSPASSVFDPEFAELEDLCRREFGFKLSKLSNRLRLLSEELLSSLDGFCAKLLITYDPAQRRDLAKAFITGIARLTDLSTDRSIRTLVKMQSTFLQNMQMENDHLLAELARSKDEAAELKAALDHSVLEKERIEAEARDRFEQEKALLEIVIREELQACQICEVNPRNVVIMPCFHGHFCAECLEVHQKSQATCPTCRGSIKGIVPYIA